MNRGGGARGARQENSLDLPSDERGIGRHTYQVSQLPMGSWLELQAMLLEALGPALAELVAAYRPAPKGEAEADLEGDPLKKLMRFIGSIDTRAIGFAINTLSTSLPAEKQQRALKLLGYSTLCDGHNLDALHWPRNMAELGPYVAFALEVQFADFFGGLANALPAREVGAGSDDEDESQSPND